jgi:uncharacterized protein (TIGR00661 family)
MKLLFIIQGEGRGHLTQALSLHQKLTADGHQVVGALVGKSPTRKIPTFFSEKMEAPVYPFESPNFLPTARNKQVNLAKTVIYNVARSYRYVGSLRYINRMIKQTEADVVVNFYEMLTGLTYTLFRPKAAMICIAHQYLFLHPEFSFPKANPLSLGMMLFYTRVTTWGSSKKLALSFRKMKEAPEKGIVVVPPLIRREVLEAEPTEGDYLHGYMLNSGFSEEVKAWHQEHPEVKIHFFWDKKGETEATRINDNLVFHPLDDALFVHYMAGSKAYATTAGFESVCEAMYMDKPVMMVPTHIEQACNAHDASMSGSCIVSDSFNLDKLLELSESYSSTHAPNLQFRHWVNQADWLILREFHEDSSSWLNHLRSRYNFFRSLISPGHLLGKS